ncbi:MAG TPA: carboxypeptidase-like regulatory domain-containing protein [Polyangia bacterium]|nr:carboxypeptidase-like regulatory domain-containing protein [Polyangia bacterium]
MDRRGTRPRRPGKQLETQASGALVGDRRRPGTRARDRCLRIAMRLCATLALVLVALVVVTVKVTRRQPRRSPTPIAPELAEPVLPVETSPTRAPAPPAHGESVGIAYLRGRFLFPPDVERTSDLEVVADDGSRRFRALIPKGTRSYEIHLPSGRYTLIASMEELVGVVPDVLARAEGTREVDIRLAIGATIRGKLTPLPGIVVSAVLSGRGDDAGDADVEDGTFSIEGLIPGQRYDLTFSGAGVRTLKVTGVAAPAEGLDVALQARAKLRGAVGFPRGARCPIENVHLLAYGGDPDDDDDADTVGTDCRFALSVPDQTSEVTVVARGPGWYLEQRVAIPPSGDPDPICLNPPCRSDPLEGLARLRLALDGGDSGSFTASADEVGGGGFHSCHGTDGRCDIEGLPEGATLSITASGQNCESDPMTVTVIAGDNHVRVPCPRQRRIEGVIRIPEGEQPDRVVLRCAGSKDLHPIRKTRLFRVTCDAAARALEYQIGTQGIWRSVPIASMTEPAFVDIGL